MSKYFTNDVQAYITYTKFNYVYNKMELVKSQGVSCSLIGVYPKEHKYPLFVKPIYNLFGMSRDVLIINDQKSYDEFLSNQPHPSLFWMPYLKGKHYTVDIIFKDGVIIFTDAFECIPNRKHTGLFLYHTHINNYCLPINAKNFLEKYVKNYDGPMNIEIIDDIIIEAHLRWNGDNHIWRENKQAFNKVIEINQKFISTTFYVPIFFKRELLIKYNDTLKLKQLKEIMERNITTIMNVNTNISLYYDDIEGQHQQNKYIRLGMIVMSIKPPDKLLNFLSKYYN